jgi:hypothetical protein
MPPFALGERLRIVSQIKKKRPQAGDTDLNDARVTERKRP